MNSDTTAGLAPYLGTAGEVGELTRVAELAKLFWRRKALLLAVAAIVFGGALAIAFGLTPLYTANARMLINLQAAQAITDAAPAGLKAAGLRALLLGEVEVLQSDRLLDRAVERLGLLKDDEFNEALPRRGGFDGWLDDGSGAALNQAALARAAHDKRLTVKTLRERLTIRPPAISNVISIAATSRDPEKAARIANGYAAIYIEDQLDRQVQLAMQARAFVNQRLRDMEAKVAAAQRAITDFIASHDFDETGAAALIDRQSGDISRQLTLAKAELAEKEVRYRQVLELAKDKDALATAGEVRRSPVIQRLRDQEGQLVRRRAELENRFGEKHPTMVNLNAQLADLHKRIAVEQQRIVEELKNEVQVATARVASLGQELGRIDSERAGLNRERLQLRRLEREADASRRLYEAFVSRAKLAEHSLPVDQSQIEFIARAKPPLEASFPRRGLVLGLGAILALSAGVFVVLLVERLDSGFHTVRQLERFLDIPSLGVVPRRSGRAAGGGRLADLVVDEQGASYVEAIRSLRTSLMVSRLDRPPKVVLIASARAGEGKTSLAVSLARLSALSAVEGNVILIDGDLRKPAVAAALGIPAERGLIHLFAGEATLEEVIQTDPRTGLQVLPATQGTPNPPELLNSHHMRSLLDRLSKSYDLIVIDSPPLESVSDARVLARLADATVFAVEWEGTPRNVALDALRQLLSAGAHVAGAVLQKVNLRRTASYGYEEA